jgi:hypothetical protein
MAHLIENIKWYLFVFTKLSIHMQIGFVTFLLICLAMVSLVISIPVFNFIVIPMIEKQINRKLTFSNFFGVYDVVIFGRFFFQHVEIMKYIVKKYCSLIFRKDENYILFCNEYALQRVNYKVETAPRFIIFMCFFTALNYLIFVLGLITTAIIAAFFNSH